MAIDFEQFTRLKKRSEKAKSDFDRAEAVLGEKLKKLQEDFGVPTIEEAEALLSKLKLELEEAEGKYSVLLEAYESKWGKV